MDFHSHQSCIITVENAQKPSRAVNGGNPEEHPDERPSRPSCYATSAARRHESQSTSKPQRAPARATLASQNSAEADRKEEIWKSGEISRNQVIWGHWPAETDGFTSLHMGVYFARAGKRAVVVFPDNRHCFLHECIICLWLPCLGLLCPHSNQWDCPCSFASKLGCSSCPMSSVISIKVLVHRQEYSTCC